MAPYLTARDFRFFSSLFNGKGSPLSWADDERRRSISVDS
nr:MAG TPA: hypothetical protein [Caudoviricetes sp.]DAM24615.1 MAG TPA: hypothetical protein [Caudoviricetes sp.]DAX58993.1 MAG TPA: hypothetical protein [Caudoviricetes sp.]